jgi:hypothetical protein
VSDLDFEWFWGGFLALRDGGLKNRPIWGFSWYPPEKRFFLSGSMQKLLETVNNE